MNTHQPVAVGLVIDTLARGGAERVLLSIANTLNRGRFRVHVLLTRDPGVLAQDLASDVAVHSLNRRTRWDVVALRRLARIVKQNDIALLHTHSHTAAYFVRLARAFSNRRWLQVMHDHHGPIEGSSLLRMLDTLFLQGVDYYFAVSDRLGRHAARRLQLPSDRWEWLVNGIPVPDGQRRRKASVFTIVQVARLTPDKNQELAIAAAARLRSNLPVFRWLLVGRTSSDYAEACRAMVDRLSLGDHVVFLGERQDVAEYLGAAHVGVLTSRYEALPIALLEYMAARLPLVVTDVGECGNVIRSSGAGFVVSSDDASGFADALWQLAQNPVAAEQAGRASAQYVRSHFSADAMVRRVEDVYTALLSGQPVPPAAIVR